MQLKLLNVVVAAIGSTDERIKSEAKIAEERLLASLKASGQSHLDIVGMLAQAIEDLKNPPKPTGSSYSDFFRQRPPPDYGLNKMPVGYNKGRQLKDIPYHQLEGHRAWIKRTWPNGERYSEVVTWITEHLKTRTQDPD
jgi:hypothetical protein